MTRLRIIMNLIAIALIIIAAMHLAFHREPPVARANSTLFATRGETDSSANQVLASNPLSSSGMRLTARLYDVRDIMLREVEVSAPARPSDQEVMDEITSMISDMVTPHDWAMNGGSVAAITSTSHWVAVCHTPEGHRAIASLLDTIRRSDSFQWPRRSQSRVNDSEER